MLLLALAFYMWTANSAVPFSFSSHNSDVYNELSTAFLHGHTSLPVAVPPGLLHLKDPYDPAQNAPYQPAILDLALWHGHFYSLWLPTPALTLFIPFRITGLRMSQSFAAALYAFIGLACAVALLHLLMRRLKPETPKWMLIVMDATLALTNVAPFILRSPLVYEVAISAGYCFSMAGILLAVTAVPRARRSALRLALSSLCFGLAVGARQPLAPVVLVAVAVAIYIGRGSKGRSRLLVAALGPFLACVLLLGLYNFARFGSLTNFGQQYQLAGADAHAMAAERLAYVPPGMFTYLLMPPRLAITFPHVFLMNAAHYPGPFPKNYAGSRGSPWPAEATGGLLPTMPITLALLLLPFLWWKRRENERPTLIVATGGALLTLTIVALLAYALWGTTQRYEVDYASIALIASFLVWALLLLRHRVKTTARRWIAAVGITLCSAGALVGVAVSITGYYTSLQVTDPSVFSTLEDLTSPIATLATMVAQKAVIARVDGPLPVSVPVQGYGQVDYTGASTALGVGPVTVTIVSPHGEQAGLTALADAIPGGPPLSRVVLGVTSPNHRQVIVPIIARSVRLPVSLHWGLNRVVLNVLSPRGTNTPVLYLGNMRIDK